MDKLRGRKTKAIFVIFICLLALLSFSKINLASATETIEYPVTTEYQLSNDLATVKQDFSLSGTATWYNEWAWLTPNLANQVGSIYLNEKIQLDSDFHIEGVIALTLKAAGSNGDGVGLVFHTGAVNQIGGSGGNLGVANLPNATALVVDTFQNTGEPVAPYVGIWSTNAQGVATIAKTYTSGLPANRYIELTYSFDYVAATKTVTFQVSYNGKPIISDNSGQGYKIQLPESMREYAFSITGATGGLFNNQYASISSAKIPVLVTNTPKVAEESGDSTNNRLVLTDENGLLYPEGSIATVNGTAYTIASDSSITVPISSIGDITQPVTITVKSFKYADSRKFEAKESREIIHTLKRNVTMTINYLDQKDNQGIYENALSSQTVKTADQLTVGVGENIETLISEKIAAGELKLAYDGYDEITVDSYQMASANDTKVTTVPTTDFAITYYYTPQTKLLEVPKSIAFGGIDPKVLQSKTTDFYPVNELANVKILNTDRTVTWNLQAKMSQPFLRDSDGQELKGNLFYQKNDAEKVTLAESFVTLMSQTGEAPYQELITALSNSESNAGIGIAISDTQKSAPGYYQGTLEWHLDILI